MSQKKRHRRDEEQRFYLLPGQGGRLYRQKQKFIIKWALIAATIISGIIAVIMYFANRV